MLSAELKHVLQDWVIRYGHPEDLLQDVLRARKLPLRYMPATAMLACCQPTQEQRCFQPGCSPYARAHLPALPRSGGGEAMPLALSAWVGESTAMRWKVPIACSP